MKKSIITLLILVFGITVYAQNLDDYMEVQRGVLKTEKKAIIAEAMSFTEQESSVFWPLYNEYNEKMYTLNTKTYNLIKDYAANFETLTDEKAVTLMKSAMLIDKELSSLEKTYFKKFQKIIPGKKAARYFQLENKIKALVDAEMALEIPLMDE